MWDIYVAIATMVVVSGLFFAFALIISSKFPRRVADFFAVLTMLGMCLYIYLLWDKAEVVWLVPYSNAIILGNWFPVITAVFSALVYHRVPPESQRKYWVVALLNLVGFFSLIQPVLGTIPECENTWDEFGFARQTSQVSCSPTSAVNLLAHYKILTDESEMAELCLTRRPSSRFGLQISEGGTSWLGLYRGFKLRLQGTHFHPRFFNWKFSRFHWANPKDPVIVSLMLKPELAALQPDLYDDLRSDGWQPRVEHNVVFSRFIEDRNRVAIIDPKVGYEEMEIERFRQLWVGRGIYLEEIK